MEELNGSDRVTPRVSVGGGNILLAGVGRADITPPTGIAHVNWGARLHDRAAGIHMPLYATVLVVSDGDLGFAIVDLDIVEIPTPQTTELRQIVADATGLPLSSIRLSFSHTHSGPPWAMDIDGAAPDLAGMELVPAYRDRVMADLAGAASRAMASLEPVSLLADQGTGGIATGRRLRDSSGRMLLGQTESPNTDDGLIVARLDARDGTPIASIIAYAAHPTTLGHLNQLISPDYPGVARRVAEQYVPAPCLCLQGSAGDQMTIEGLSADVAVCERMGMMLGLEAARLLLRLDISSRQLVDYEIVESGAPLAIWRSERAWPAHPQLIGIAHASIDLPVKTARPLDVLAAERAIALAEASQQTRGTAAASIANYRAKRAAMEMQRAEAIAGCTHVPVEMQIFSIGDLALVATPLEPFASVGAAIAAVSPFRFTQFAGYSNGWEGYVPTAQDFAYGGYETEIGTPFSSDAASVLIEETNKLLQQLHQAVSDRRSDFAST